MLNILDDEDQHDRYLATPDNVKEVIDKYGVAIIPNILNQDEVNAMVNGMWDYLELVTSKFDKPINRDDKSTYVGFFDLLPLHSMLVQHWQVGHAQYVWDLRQNPKIVNIFAKIWNVSMEDLTVSFDGVGISMHFEDTNRGFYRGNNWYHTDQTIFDSSMKCIQSWVTGFDVRKGDATLTILEGSHKHHDKIQQRLTNIDAKTQTKLKKDWYKLDAEELEYFKSLGCKPRNIVCNAGSMVLWDSRTMHAGKEPSKTRIQPNFRNVVYLCYTPKNLLSGANAKKKQKAFNEKRMTSHWPHKVILFPKTPRTYGNSLPQITDVPTPKLTELGKRLAGF